MQRIRREGLAAGGIRLAALFGLAAVLAACRGPATQLVVVVTTDLPAGAIAAVHVEAHALAAAVDPVLGQRDFVITPQGDIDAGVAHYGLPLSLGVRPGGSDNAGVILEATALDARGARITLARAITQFRAGQALQVELFLSASCPDVCTSEFTCGHTHRCVDAHVEGSTFDSLHPGSELDAGAPIPPPTPTACDGAACNRVVQIGVGVRHACAVLGSGDLYCWGSNAHQQLGVPAGAAGTQSCQVSAGFDEPCAQSPIRIPGVPPVRAAALGDNNTCAITLTGDHVWCWGDDTFQGLAVPSDPACDCVRAPQEIAALAGVADLSMADFHACGRFGDAARCWGLNECAERGTTRLDRNVGPVDGLPAGVTQVSSALDDTCAVSAGAVYCWGANGDQQLGSTTAPWDGGIIEQCPGPMNYTGVATPVPLPAGDPPVEVATGTSFACARLTSGAVYCWGRCLPGFRSDNFDCSAGAVLAPLPSDPPVRAAHLDAGPSYACAALVAGGIECWGIDDNGQLGTGSSGDHRATLLAGTHVAQLAAGGSMACALTDDGTVQCWGWGGAGELGVGTSMLSYSAPRPVVGLPQ